MTEITPEVVQLQETKEHPKTGFHAVLVADNDTRKTLEIYGKNKREITDALGNMEPGWIIAGLYRGKKLSFQEKKQFTIA